MNGIIDYNDICLSDSSLRDYQQLAKEKIFSQWNVVDNILYQMPTGTGKTRLFTSIIRDINIWGLKHNRQFRILIIAHRSELIEQSSRSLSKYHIEHGVLSGAYKEKRNLMLPIQVASIQTITHPSNEYLLRDINIDFIIIDEAHHAIANSYQKLWHLCPDSKKLGVTATPWRMNGGGFKSIFEAYIPSMPIREFIEKGWLASYQYYSIPSDSEIQKKLDGIKEFDIDGDYKRDALVKVFDDSKIRAQLYRSYAKIAFGKKGIIYSISRNHSEHICAQYRSHGVRIENIDSLTPAKERELVIERFKKGLIDIIVNVDIFSEGFDCPDIEFIQLARPTKSLVKYLQQVGRGIRKNGDKRCLILDNVGMYSKFGMPDSDRDWTAYFEGNNNVVAKLPSNRNQANREEQFADDVVDEGNEKMILIQDYNPIVSNDESVENKSYSKIDTEIGTSPNQKSITLRSKPFYYGKYVIEENEEGFFVCNPKTNERVFLMKLNTFPGGVIVVSKTDKSKSFQIEKRFSKIASYHSKGIIIGYINKDGLLFKFSSFDKTVVDKNIVL